SYARSVTYFSSARFRSPQSSQDACCSMLRMMSAVSMPSGELKCSVTVTWERWLCAPYSEMALEQGHRLVTGTTSDKLNAGCSNEPSASRATRADQVA